MKRRLSIGTVLLLMNLTVLLLPASGIWALRLYESALVRQTESELIAQGAVIAAAFRVAWHANGGQIEVTAPKIDPRWTRRPGFEQPWLPRSAALDLAADPILPPPPDSEPAAGPADEAARLAGESLTPLLRDAQLVTLAGMRVADRTGRVVASTGESLGWSVAGQEEVRRALAGEPVSVLRLRGKGAAPSPVVFDRGSLIRVFTATPVLDGDHVIGVVLLSRTPHTIREALYGKRRHLAGLAVVLLAVIAGFAVLGTLTISRPLRAVTEQAKRTAGGERGAMSPVAHPMLREVAELSEALTRMAATLEQRADYIRDFAAHVSHEFKTPLTTIRGTVELLREHLDDMSAPDRERFLANLEAEAERLTRLVTRLLELARAGVMQTGEECRPAAVLARLAGRFRAQGMNIEVTEAADVPVAMGEEALEAVLTNLLNNAHQHAGPDVRVSVSLRCSGETAVLKVADDGSGVSPADTERIFAPFFTTATSNGGTGLGLAIANSLVSAHGGSLRLVPSGKGAVFEVMLPCGHGGVVDGRV